MQRADRPPVDCYRAGVLAWRQHYPDQVPEYSAKAAVAVLLEANRDRLMRIDKL
jgi:hypothetical protein